MTRPSPRSTFPATFASPSGEQPLSRQQIALSIIAIVFMFGFGTAGYVSIEGWSPFDAFYMTVITLTTIGYGETHVLSWQGRLFTIFLIFIGLGGGMVILTSVWRVMIEQQLSRMVDRGKRMRGRIGAVGGHTIFCGFSRLGRVSAEELRRAGTDVVVIEMDEHRAADAERAGFLVVVGDATIDETLVAAGVSRAKRLVTLLPKDSDNLYVILTAREMNPSLYIVSRAEDDVGERRLQRAGVNRLISTYRLAARKLADGLLRPYITDFFEVAGAGEDGWKIEEIRIPDNSQVCGKSLAALSLRQRANVSIAAIVNPKGELELNPSGDTVLDSGSTLIVIGWRKDIEALEGFVLPQP